MKNIRKDYSEQLCAIEEHCRNHVIELLTTNDTKLFDLIDPLVSDNQCQVHSLFVLNTLLKSYRYDDCSYDLNQLDEDDMEILSDAILLTLLKSKLIDESGFVLRQESLEHFGGCVDSKKKEAKFISKIKERFNTKSMKFVRRIAKDSVKCILDDCVANISHTKIKLQILPCYATVYAFLAHIKMERLPILISLKRFELRITSSAKRYKVNSIDLYYYKWNGTQFQCHENLKECELKRPCITIDCWSLYNVRSSPFNYKYAKFVENKSKFPSHSFFLNCDIGHLVITSLAAHFQLSESKTLVLNPGYDTSDHYINSIYRNSSIQSTNSYSFSVESQFNFDGLNVYEQYLAHLSLAKDINGECSQYAKIQNGVATRRIQNAFFSAHHCRVSSYFHEDAKRLRLDGDVEKEQAHLFSIVDKNVAAILSLRNFEYEISKTIRFR